MPRLLGREPALVVGAVNALIMLAATLGWHLLSPDQAPLWVAVVNGASAAILAIAIRPLSAGVFSQLFASIVALVAGYGIELSAEFVFAANAAIVPILALLTRGQVSPIDGPLTKTTPNPTAEAALHDIGDGGYADPDAEEAQA